MRVCTACGNAGSDVKVREVPAVRGFPADKGLLHEACTRSMSRTEQEVRDDVERTRR